MSNGCTWRSNHIKIYLRPHVHCDIMTRTTGFAQNNIPISIVTHGKARPSCTPTGGRPITHLALSTAFAAFAKKRSFNLNHMSIKHYCLKKRHLN